MSNIEQEKTSLSRREKRQISNAVYKFLFCTYSVLLSIFTILLFILFLWFQILIINGFEMDKQKSIIWYCIFVSVIFVLLIIAYGLFLYHENIRMKQVVEWCKTNQNYPAVKLNLELYGDEKSFFRFFHFSKSRRENIYYVFTAKYSIENDSENKKNKTKNNSKKKNAEESTSEKKETSDNNVDSSSKKEYEFLISLSSWFPNLLFQAECLEKKLTYKELIKNKSAIDNINGIENNNIGYLYFEIEDIENHERDKIVNELNGGGYWKIKINDQQIVSINRNTRPMKFVISKISSNDIYI